MVERQELGLDLRHPVDVEEVPPDGDLRLGRRGDRLEHEHGARRDPVVVGEVEPVERVGLRRSVVLEHRDRELSAALAAPLRVVQDARVPPRSGAREHARRLRARAVVDRRAQTQRLVAPDNPHRPLPLHRPHEVGVRSRDLHVAAERRQAVAVAPVDRGLGSPERCEGLAARVDVVELGAHELAEDPAPAMGRQDADNRHARGPHRPAGDGEVELERAGAADDRIPVRGEVHSSLGEHLEDPARSVLLRPRRRPEVVPDRLERVEPLVAARGTDLDAVQRTFSSGA